MISKGSISWTTQRVGQRDNLLPHPNAALLLATLAKASFPLKTLYCIRFSKPRQDLWLIFGQSSLCAKETVTDELGQVLHLSVLGRRDGSF